MTRYRIVFMGTPAFAVPSLRALLAGPDRVSGVVCQPDRPAGRGQRLHAPPVKEVALDAGISVAQPERIRTAEFQAGLAAWQPDLIVVAAYGRILPPPVLALPRLGCVNVHASLLPKYRGAAPVQSAILNGESTTGVTIMQMNERMDEGDILLQRATPIGAAETYGALESRLAVLGADLLLEALAHLHAGTLVARPQDHAAATLAPLVKKEDGRIDWTQPAERIARQVRAFNPWPSAFTWIDRKRLTIHGAHAAPAPVAAPPGTVLVVGETIEVSTGAGRLVIEELQIEGRRRLGAAEFARGGGLNVGARLGASPATA